MRLLTRQGYRICDGVDIFDNFLEIFFVFEDKKERAGENWEAKQCRNYLAPGSF